MKRKVVYVELLAPLVVGKSTSVIPLNHSDTLRVSNGYPCWTTPVQNIAPDGKTFSTLNTLYVPLADPGDEKTTITAKEMEHA